MKKLMLVKTAALVSALLLAQVASAAPVECKMSFNISGWSLIYKHSSGTGKISCSDGTRMNVKITANGGGLTAGKSKIEGGIGKFSGVNSISEIPGVYAQADAPYRLRPRDIENLQVRNQQVRVQHRRAGRRDVGNGHSGHSSRSR